MQQDITPVEGLEFRREGGIATITLSRPDKLNAITFRMVEGLTQWLDQCGMDDSVRAIIITGAGRAFSSGDDIVGGMGDPSRVFTADVGIGTDLGPHHALGGLRQRPPRAKRRSIPDAIGVQPAAAAP